jgi:hypothetical protein
MRRLSRLLSSVTIVAAVACTNAGQSLSVPAIGTGTLAVDVYFDRDNSLTLTSADTVFAGVRVALLVPGGNDTVRTVTTNEHGIAIFDSLRLGSYRLVVDRHALGDTVGVVAGDTGTVRLINQPDSVNSVHLIRLGYTEVSLAQMRTMPVGRRVFVRGKVTVPLQVFRDTSTFITDTSGSIRILSTRTLPGQTGNNYGDSVLVLGTTGRAQGQAVLLNGLVRTVAFGISPIPLVISAADARTARNGSLDAVLVQISNVVISDTASSNPDFLVKVTDPADTTHTPTTILVDQLLNAPHSYFRIGASITVKGVLVPLGDGTWVIKPRGGSDLIIN